MQATGPDPVETFKKVETMDLINEYDWREKIRTASVWSLKAGS